MLTAFPLWAAAGFWGFVSGSALIVGALAGYYTKVSKKLIAFIMAFGSGVLISALAFDLMDDAYERGGFDATAIGFIGGAVLYSVINYYLSRKGAKHRKRSGSQQPAEADAQGSGMAILAGTILDGIPESIAIGVSMIEGGAVSRTAVIAIFLSNIPEALSSTSGMKRAGRSSKYIFGIWIAITLMSAIAAFCGYFLFKGLSPDIIAGTIAVAAGGILAMVSDTMIPEAYEEGHYYIGLMTVLGFLAAFILTKMT